MNNREVAHKWASTEGDSDKGARGSHFFFEGRAIYSYGHHFKVAEFVKGHPGHVFFTRRSYSSTTAKHKSYVRGAIGGHLRVWLVEDDKDATGFYDHAANVRAYLADMETARASALKARTNADYYRAEAEGAAIKAGEYAQEFGTGAARALKRQALKFAELARSGALFNLEELAGVRERVAAAKEANREQAKKRDALAAAKLAEDMGKLDAWTRGEPNAYAPSSYGLPTRLRLKDGRIETSRGAQITERAARLLWAALVRGRDVAGVELDSYTVRSWDGRALVVGCHTIEAGELIKMAVALGLGGALPSASTMGEAQKCDASGGLDGVCQLADGHEGAHAFGEDD